MSDNIPPTVRGKQHVFGDGSAVEVVARSGRDADETTVFSWNPTGIGIYDDLELRFQLYNQVSGDNNLTLTINGDTTLNYRYVTKTGAAFDAAATGQSSWLVGTVNWGYPISGSVRITPGNIPKDVKRPTTLESINPAVSADIAMYHTKTVLDRGDLAASHSSINSLTLATGGVATGSAILVGWKY